MAVNFVNSTYSKMTRYKLCLDADTEILNSDNENELLASYTAWQFLDPLE